MALLFVDSFDHYDTANLLNKWTTSGLSGTAAALTITSGAGRRSTSGFRSAVGNFVIATGFIQKVLAPADATCVIGVAVSMPTGLSGSLGYQLLSIRDGSSPQITLRVNPTMQLAVVRGASDGTVLGTTTATLAAGVLTYVELKVTIHNSAGTVEVRIGGATALTLSGVDTQNTGAAQWGSVSLGQQDGVLDSITGAAGKNVDFDDLYVCDGSGSAPWNTLLGDCRVDASLPTAAGASTGWTPSAGANWQCVDDAAPNDDTDYNQSTAVGQIDSFVVPDAPGGTIHGVQVVLTAKKLDAGGATIAPVVRIGSTDYVGSDLTPGTTYGFLRAVYPTSPATAAVWTTAEFNAAEFGYKKTA